MNALWVALALYVGIAVAVIVTLTFMTMVATNKPTWRTVLDEYRAGTRADALKEAGATVAIGLIWPAAVLIVGWLVCWSIAGDR